MATASPHVHLVQIYYEDTDFSGVVYHANYLKYFERAREHLIGVDELVRLFREDGIGFVVYKAELTFREGAVHGDTLEIRTRVSVGSEYRAVFHQEVWRQGGKSALVVGSVDLVCVDPANKLVPLPQRVIEGIRAFA
ncbi:MAG: YbgC/FadM family acyl-CoA thioesterase [Deltaproteobacteria bacterium]|nr:MAG: YbgC/FadM family acyl-CoA thioesterase [Deltaproteobacteria bacterium]